MHPLLASFYLDQPEPLKSCLQYLRTTVLNFDKEIRETRKYCMPCYTFKDKHFCYIWKDKKTNHPYLLIVEGHLIDHPALIQDHRKRMKILPINPTRTINIAQIEEVLSQAKSLCI